MQRLVLSFLFPHHHATALLPSSLILTCRDEQEAKGRAWNRGRPSGMKRQCSWPQVATKPRESASCLVSLSDRERVSCVFTRVQQTRSHFIPYSWLHGRKPLSHLSSLSTAYLCRPAQLSSVTVTEQASQCGNARLLQAISVTDLRCKQQPTSLSGSLKTDE